VIFFSVWGRFLPVSAAAFESADGKKIQVQVSALQGVLHS
jgi:hypothetical protein